MLILCKPQIVAMGLIQKTVPVMHTPLPRWPTALRHVVGDCTLSTGTLLHPVTKVRIIIADTTALSPFR